MKRILLAVALVAAFPTAAAAKTVTPRHAGVYEHVYHHAAAKYGKSATGCNLLSTCHSRVTEAKTLDSTAVLERLLYPSPAPVVVASTTYSVPGTSAATTATPATPVSNGSGGYTIPSGIVQCESGGNYGAVNPSSGAGGAYQILPSTWSAYGGQGAPQNASPAQQGAIAAKIYASQGASAWVC